MAYARHTIISGCPSKYKKERSNLTKIGALKWGPLKFKLFSRDGVEDTRLEAKAKDTKKKSEAKAKDSLSEDRHSRGQGQECLRPRPRTQALVLSKKKKKKKKRSSQKVFKRSPQKNVFQKSFQALHKILTIQKILLSSSRGQANFRGLEASRPRPRT